MSPGSGSRDQSAVSGSVASVTTKYASSTVNVRAGAPPDWLRAVLHRALDDSAAYPDARPARAAVAAAHGREPDEVLLTAGAAETFTLVARALAPRRAFVVHAVSERLGMSHEVAAAG